MNVKELKSIGNNKNLSKGQAGNNMIFGIVTLLIVGGFVMVGGKMPSIPDTPYLTPSKEEIVAPVLPSPGKAQNVLQLLSFSGATLTPLPMLAPTVHGCSQADGAFLNTESEILQGFDPGPNGVASIGGKIRVWVKDESPPFISPNEKVDPTSGAITTAGDHTALDTNTDGEGNFFWEPTLFVVTPTQQLNANQIYCDVKTAGCLPHFPNNVKGDYNTADNFSANSSGSNNSSGLKGPAVEDDSAFLNGPNPNQGNPNGSLADAYFAEYTWDVDALGLQPGTYIAQFTIHDGDENLAIDCFTIQI